MARKCLYKKALTAFVLQVLEIYGAPEEIRTPDLQVRSLVLYPAELRAQGALIYAKK